MLNFDYKKDIKRLIEADNSSVKEAASQISLSKEELLRVRKLFTKRVEKDTLETLFEGMNKTKELKYLENSFLKTFLKLSYVKDEKAKLQYYVPLTPEDTIKSLYNEQPVNRDGEKVPVLFLTGKYNSFLMTVFSYLNEPVPILPTDFSKIDFTAFDKFWRFTNDYVPSSEDADGKYTPTVNNFLFENMYLGDPNSLKSVKNVSRGWDTFNTFLIKMVGLNKNQLELISNKEVRLFSPGKLLQAIEKNKSLVFKDSNKKVTYPVSEFIDFLQSLFDSNFYQNYYCRNLQTAFEVLARRAYGNSFTSEGVLKSDTEEDADEYIDSDKNEFLRSFPKYKSDPANAIIQTYTTPDRIIDDIQDIAGSQDKPLDISKSLESVNSLINNDPLHLLITKLLGGPIESKLPFVKEYMDSILSDDGHQGWLKDDESTSIASVDRAIDAYKKWYYTYREYLKLGGRDELTQLTAFLPEESKKYLDFSGVKSADFGYTDALDIGSSGELVDMHDTDRDLDPDFDYSKPDIDVELGSPEKMEYRRDQYKRQGLYSATNEKIEKVAKEKLYNVLELLCKYSESVENDLRSLDMKEREDLLNFTKSFQILKSSTFIVKDNFDKKIKPELKKSSPGYDPTTDSNQWDRLATSLRLVKLADAGKLDISKDLLESLKTSEYSNDPGITETIKSLVREKFFTPKSDMKVILKDYSWIWLDSASPEDLKTFSTLLSKYVDFVSFNSTYYFILEMKESSGISEYLLTYTPDSSAAIFNIDTLISTLNGTSDKKKLSLVVVRPSGDIRVQLVISSDKYSSSENYIYADVKIKKVVSRIGCSVKYLNQQGKNTKSIIPDIGGDLLISIEGE